MSHRTLEWIDAAGGRFAVDTATGALANAELPSSGREFVDGSTAGLLRLAVPLAGYGSHYLEVGTHGEPQITRVGDTLRLTYT
jgi:hypothetical protein